ncbi:MAG: ABC transporter permease [Chloroflexi bacterium]|nr:ABC transporter permease [Chloroflexota bacterium]
MLQGLLDQIGALGVWFADPANWSGNDGIPNRMTEHIVICLLSMVAALLVSVPVGLFIGHTNRLSFLAVTLANIGRAVPSYAVMALLFPLSIAFSVMGPGGDIAYLATFLAMVLLAIPPVVTNTYAGMQGVERDLLEAARGMGMRGHEVLRSVELPLALPVALTGIRIASVQVVATATLGAVFGGGGLGRFIIQGQARNDDARLWAGAILVALLAIATELLFAVLVRRANGKVRGAAAPAAPTAPTAPTAPEVPFGSILDQSVR